MKDVGSISPSLIPLKLFEAAGIEHPYYTGFLGRVDARYDVIERHVLISPSGATPDWSQEKLIDPLINDFRLLQYDAHVRQAADREALLPQPAEACGRVNFWRLMRRSPGCLRQ